MTLFPEIQVPLNLTVPFTEAMKKLEAGFSSAFQEKEETFAKDQDTQEE